MGTAPGGPVSAAYVADAVVDVQPPATTGIVLTLRQGPTVRGELSTVGAAASSAARGALALSIVPAAQLILGSVQSIQTVAVGADGTLLSAPLFPGRYTFSPLERQDVTLGWRLKGQTSVTSCPFALVQDLALSLVLADSAAISGVVSTTASDPAVVLAFPADGRPWSEITCDDLGVRKVALDKEGRFVLRAVPPGDYFVIAMPERSTGDAWKVEETLAALRISATRVTAQANATVSVQLTLSRP